MKNRASSLKILVVDDEPELCKSLCHTLSAHGHQATAALGAAEALESVRQRLDSPQAYQIVLLDVCMPEISGLEVLRKFRSWDPGLAIMIMTAHANIRDAVEAMREGAYNYLEKPVQENELTGLVDRAAEAYGLAEEMRLSSPKIFLEDGSRFIGRSQKMRAVFEVIARLGQVNTSVLIRGENGTGKELVARAIHFNSPRKDKPFVAINCGAIPENLVESEFFGHEKGAFTGADQRHIGKFQYAEGGTLFLDEVGELSPSMQVKLLRILQERKFTPVGSNREIKCDVRIIAATHRNLEELIAERLFRQDLFYRLNVMPIELPPLRQRVEDLPRLVEHFIEKFNHSHGRDIQGIRPEALSAMSAYGWPGNIRELENMIERAFVMENGKYISLSSLPEFLQERKGAGGTELTPFHNQKEQFEKEFIVNALKQYAGKINQTVAHAGIPKNTLLRKIRKYGINPADYGAVDVNGEDR